MKKLICAVPLALSVASFAAGDAGGSTFPSEDMVESATSDLVTWGGYIIGGIAGVIAVSAGLRLLVKGVNRAVGK